MSRPLGHFCPTIMDNNNEEYYDAGEVFNRNVIKEEEEEEEEKEKIKKELIGIVFDLLQKKHAVNQQQPAYSEDKPKGSNRSNSSNVPKPKMQRIQRSYVVREVRSKFPVEIEGAVRQLKRAPLDVLEPLNGFLGILRDYMGYDPATLEYGTIEDRLLRSSKADDESDSEHYQRLMSALDILNNIKQSRVSNLKMLIELAQKDLIEDRQHKRFSDAIQIKRDTADSKISKEGTDTRLAEQELLEKQRREDHVGYVSRELEAAEARAKLALLTDFPHRPMNAHQVPHGQTNFDRRLAYVREKLLKR